MGCPIPQRRFLDFSSSLEEASIKQRIHYMGALELTHRCNQACCHCYCNLKLNDERKNKELTLNEIKRILDEIADAGCLWLLLTGGEVLIREEFWEIYLYALRKGILLDVFTNATLINEDAVKRFKDAHALGIDISIYGSNPIVHDRITGVRGSFDKALEGINLLLKYKVPFSLKTMILTLNYADLKNMQELAKGLGAELKFDCQIFPRMDGDRSPLKYSLTMEEIVELELNDERNFKAYKEIFNIFWGKEFNEPFICMAGVNSFNIDPYGILSPCTMFAGFNYSLKNMPFGTAWDILVQEYGSGPQDFIYPECKPCNMQLICPRCIAWSELETKRLGGKIESFCEYAKILEKKFFQKKEVESEKENLSKTPN